MADRSEVLEQRSLQSGDSITPSDYRRLTDVVYAACGIRLNASKQLMVETRLRKRLRATGANTFLEYWQLLAQEDNRGGEFIRFIDAITTNKTEFFREPRHFDYLVNRLLPELGPRLKSEKRPLRIWSAGCSTGKEPYTLAMVLEDCRRARTIADFQILGTDISTEVLQRASRAVYEEADIEPIPEPLRKQYLLRSRNRRPPTFRIAPELRSVVSFQRLNFMDDHYPVEGVFDIIFCRNVIIYFDRATQEQVIRKFAAHLPPGGYLFTGHSETLNGISSGFSNIAPTIYRKAGRA